MMPRQLVNIEVSLKGAFGFNIQRTSTIRSEVFWKRASSSETSVNIYQSKHPHSCRLESSSALMRESQML